MLTQRRLKELLRYESETGIFTRICRQSSNAKVGDTPGRLDTHGYLCFYVDGQIHRSHRLAWLYVNGEFPEGDLDHINTIKTDNRIVNLRIADRSENMQNRRSAYANNKSGFLGVYFHKPLNKFTAQIRIDGRNTHLGLFKTPEQAHQAYVAAKRKHHKGGML